MRQRARASTLPSAPIQYPSDQADYADKRDTGWIRVPDSWYLNSWEEHSDTYRVEYRVKDGEVMFRGLIKNGTPPSYAIDLPTQLGPLTRTHNACATNGGYGRISVYERTNASNPSRIYIGTGNATWTSLDDLRWYLQGDRV